MPRLTQPLIVVLACIPECALALSAADLWERFLSGDIASGVVLAICTFLTTYALRAQLAVVLARVATVLEAVGSPGAHRLVHAAALICPRILRATLATSLAAGIGLAGIDTVWATPPVHDATAVAPTADAEPSVPYVVTTAKPASPGWPDSGNSPGWPDSETVPPSTAEQASPDTTGPPSSGAAQRTAPDAEPPAHRAAGPDTKTDGGSRTSHAAGQGSRGTAPSSTAREKKTTADTVTVRRGDTLWTIATHHLRAHGKATTNAAVARHVLQIHRANADVIGQNPDLIVPGQRLELP